MHFHFRNVNDAFKRLVSGIHQGHIPTVCEPSRAGEVLRIEEPVIITYSHPQERVLFNRKRDCNPFFHLFESLWMLAGRNNLASLGYYNSRMQEFSDNGKTFHGAYGYRWCNYPGCPTAYRNQLGYIIRVLQDDPTSRRAVLGVWDPKLDLVPQAEQNLPYLNYQPGRDYPCNTHAYFSLRGGALDMTVCNRSNDLIWGTLGTNVVHWSMLQEYLAACLKARVGYYHQISNNAHVYTAHWEPEGWLAAYAQEPKFDYDEYHPVPLVQNPARFDGECIQFVSSIDGNFGDPFLHFVAQPMCAAFRAHKLRRYRGDNGALELVNAVQAEDWRTAGTAWIDKRMRHWKAIAR